MKLSTNYEHLNQNIKKKDYYIENFGVKFFGKFERKSFFDGTKKVRNNIMV